MARRSSDLALLKLAQVELDTSGSDRSFPASSDMSFTFNIIELVLEVRRDPLSTLHTAYSIQ